MIFSEAEGGLEVRLWAYLRALAEFAQESRLPDWVVIEVSSPLRTKGYVFHSNR